jgi:transcriptional regulator with XRE-family HTH domain
MHIHVANNLKHFRTQLGITQTILAEKLGVSHQTVSKWERGLIYPDIVLLPDLAAILHVSVDVLLGSSTLDRTDYLNSVYHRLSELNAGNDIENQKLLLWEAVRKYPDEYPIVNRLINLHVVLAKQEPLSHSVYDTLILMGENLIARCNDEQMIDNTYRALALVCAQSNYYRGKAYEYFEKMPIIKNIRSSVVEQILPPDDKRTHSIIQRACIHHIMDYANGIYKLTNLIAYSDDDKLAILKRMISVVDGAFLPNEEGWSNHLLAKAYRDIARIYAKQGKIEESLAFIKKSLVTAKKYMNILQFNYTAPELCYMDYVRNTYYWKPDVLSEIINSYKTEEVFKPIKSNLQLDE